jgi:hypothetical protein
MEPLGLVLSLTAAGLVIGLIMIFLWRRLFAEFPWFFAYLASSVVVTAVRLSLRGDYLTIFKVYWATEAVYALLALLALHEVFRRVFFAFYLFRWFWPVFPTAVVGIVLITFTGELRVAKEAPQLVRLVLAVGVTAKYVEAGLFVVFVLLVALLNVTWRTYAFGIVNGFAVSALGGWLSYGVTSEFGTKFTALAKYSHPVAYILAVIIWLITFARPEAPGATERWILAITPDELVTEIKHNTVLLWRFIRKRDGR